MGIPRLNTFAKRHAEKLQYARNRQSNANGPKYAPDIYQENIALRPEEIDDVEDNQEPDESDNAGESQEHELEKIYWFENTELPYTREVPTTFLDTGTDSTNDDVINSIIIDANNLKFFLMEFNCDRVIDGETRETVWTSQLMNWSHFQIKELCEEFAEVLSRLNIKVFFVEDSEGFLDGRKNKGRDETKEKLCKKVGNVRKMCEPDGNPYPYEITQNSLIDNMHGIGGILKTAFRSKLPEDNLVCLKGTLEADATLARIAYNEAMKGRNAYILTNDSDLLLYPHVKGCITNLIDFSTKHPYLEGNPPAIRFNCIYPEGLNFSLFNITPENERPIHVKPAVWAALNGNDYIWPAILAPFHDYIRRNWRGRFPNGRIPDHFNLGFRTTTFRMQKVKNWKRILLMLSIPEQEIENGRIDDGGNFKIMNANRFNPYTRKRKTFHVALRNSPLGILEVSIFKFYYPENDERYTENDNVYEISLSVANMRCMTLIEDRLIEQGLYNLDEPFIFLQLLDRDEKYKLFLEISKYLSDQTHEFYQEWSPLQLCIEIIERSYRGSYTPPFMNGLQLRENVSEEWHRNYRRHVENWLGLRKLRVTANLINTRLGTSTAEERRTLLDRVNVKLQRDQSNPQLRAQDILLLYNTSRNVNDPLDVENRRYIEVWLSQIDNGALVTRTRIREQIYKAIDPYTMMQGFHWNVRTRSQLSYREQSNPHESFNNLYETSSTGLVELRTLSSKAKTAFPLNNTFDLTKPLFDAKYTIQYFDIDTLTVTGDVPLVQRTQIPGEAPACEYTEILAHREYGSEVWTPRTFRYTFGQEQRQTLLFSRLDRCFDYKVYRAPSIEGLDFQEIQYHEEEFAPDDNLITRMSLNSILTDPERDQWKGRFLSFLHIMNDGQLDQSYIGIDRFLVHGNDYRDDENNLDRILSPEGQDLVNRNRDSIELLFLTLWYWIDQGTNRYNNEGEYPCWFLQKQWLQALLAVIFKRLFNAQGKSIGNNEEVARPNYNVMKLMSTWMDLISSIEGLINTIDNKRVMLINQNNLERQELHEELRDNLYEEDAGVLRNANDVHRNVHLNNLTELFQSSETRESKTLNVFAVDWKSTVNALTLLNPPNGDDEIHDETFIDNCGLERDAKIMFLTFFEFLWTANPAIQAAAF